MAQQNIVNDVTETTRVIECDYDFYFNQSEKTDHFYPSTIYLVSNGVDPEDNNRPYTDLYFGPRKLTDLIIVDNYPGDPEYPNDKIYLKPGLNKEGIVTGYTIYFKHSDVVVPVASSDSAQLISGIENNNDGTVTITWITTEGENEVTLLVAGDGNDILPPQILESLKNYLYEALKDKEGFSVKWKSIKSVLSD